jgi:hypothetical protein
MNYYQIAVTCYTYYMTVWTVYICRTDIDALQFRFIVFNDELFAVISITKF